MEDANREIAVLWRGEGAIQAILERDRHRMLGEDIRDLEELLVELQRVRLLRVARWNARKRAKQARARARQAQERRGNDRAAQIAGVFYDDFKRQLKAPAVGNVGRPATG